MRIASLAHRSTRRGTVLPMLALCLVALFAFVALAVDLGMLAVSRTRCQNGADSAALAGCRQLNNKPSAVNSNLPSGVTVARGTVTGNNHLSASTFANADIQKVEVGQYLYDFTSQQFKVTAWTDATNNQATVPATGSWTAIRVTLAVSQPTYFMKVWGVNTMPTGATATAIYRPRDTAFVLDMTGSMAFGSQFNYNSKSNNPDTLVPRFGHYFNTRTNSIQSVNNSTGAGEAIPQNNFSIYTPGGPPIIRDYWFDPSNLANPTTVVSTVTVANLRDAFHRWNPPESGASQATYKGPQYAFGGYNAFDTTNTSGPTPAPDNFIDQMDSGTILYVGDRHPRRDGRIYKTPTSSAANGSGYPYPLTNPTPSWDATTANGAARHAADYLGYTTSAGVSTAPAGFLADWSDFRDPNWETNGYDLKMDQYRALRGAGGPINPTTVPASMIRTSADTDRFKGYSMGPGYWGKTMFAWPPDPRFDTTANVLAPNPSDPAFDTSGKPICDWRRRFFTANNASQAVVQTRTGTTTTTNSTITTNSPATFDPQGDNNSFNGSAAGSIDGINEVLFNAGTGNTLAGATSTQTIARRTTLTDNNFSPPQVTVTNNTVSTAVQNYQVNYAAVLRWIKTGPQVLPPNLRAGRVVFYTSIPDDVNTATGSAAAILDKVFWKNYIDYVLGWSLSNGAYLYGQSDSWSGAARSVTTVDLVARQLAWEASGRRPNMRYTDSPGRPRLHFWFGPMSMMDFIGGLSGNWNPGTVHEAHCWQLKAGMNSVLDDVRNNHPNDYVGMTMFAGNSFNDMRVPIGQDFTSLKNALFYPKSLLTAIKAGNTTSEVRPYNTSFGNALAGDDIPNANGSTDPNTGLAYAFNLLSPSAFMPAQYTTTVNSQQVRARRGASKMVILETDGVPNTYRGLSSSTQTMNPTLRGYDTFYPTSTWSSGNIGNGNTTVMSEAIKIVNQMKKDMATANTVGADSGLSLPNAKVKVFPVGFGDLFDANLAPGATFRPTALQFLANVGAAGNTGTAGATSPPTYQIITGDYTTRISTLKDCMQRIFQSGIAVSLIE